MVGKLFITLGCMFSGKTSKIFQEYNKYKSINQNPICINHILDIKFEKELDKLCETHNKCVIPCLYVDKLLEIPEELIREHNIIFINEAQFFNADNELEIFVRRWCEQDSKIIHVSGLSGSFERKKFGKILDLIPISDDVTMLHACCKKCSENNIIEDANFSLRLISDKKEIVIGSDIYMPVCRKHYLEEIVKLKNGEIENKIEEDEIEEDEIEGIKYH